jgi:hypothetical protein
MSRARITNEDRIDNLLCSVTLEEAESLLERAAMVMKIRRREAEALKKAQASLPLERGK